MVTFQELLNAQPDRLKDSADAWNKWSLAVRNHADQLASVRGNLSTQWTGLASTQAHSYVADTHSRVSASVGGLTKVEGCLNSAFTRFAQAHNDLVAVSNEAAGLGFSVTDNGQVADPGNVIGQAKGQRQAQLQQQMVNLQGRIDKAVLDATTADKAVATTLRDLMPGPAVLAGAPRGGSTASPSGRVDYSRSGDIPVPPNALSNAPDPRAKAVLSYALDQLGKPYVFGAEGPNAYDCSGLTSMAYRAAGIEIPRTADVQWQHGPRIPNGQEQPGDLVFFHMGPTGPGHVGIVLDPAKGTMIVAPHTGDHVKIEDYSHYPGLVGFTRPGVR